MTFTNPLQIIRGISIASTRALQSNWVLLGLDQVGCNYSASLQLKFNISWSILPPFCRFLSSLSLQAHSTRCQRALCSCMQGGSHSTELAQGHRFHASAHHAAAMVTKPDSTKGGQRA
jgi:hypothetical protein